MAKRSAHLVLLLLGLLMTLFACENKGDVRVYDEKDVLNLADSNDSVIVSKNLEILGESKNNYTKVLRFAPSEDSLAYETIKGEKFSFIKLPSDSTVKGKLEYENDSEEEIVIQSLFFQGSENVPIKVSSSTKWVPAINYKVPPKTSVTIDVDLKLDKEGTQEIIFFPLEKTSEAYRYNGGNLSTFRYFLQSKDIGFDSEDLKKQSFKLDENDNDFNYFPEPTWVGKDNEELEYKIKGDQPITNKKINGLKLSEVPYNTKVDIIKFDEYGNSSLIRKGVNIKKNQSTIIELNKNELSKMFDESKRQFVLLINNRGKDMIADLKALDIDKKPFPTSFQRVIEFYKNEE